jgi:hypothetical protein
MLRYAGVVWMISLLICLVVPADGHAITISAPKIVEAGKPVTIIVSGVPLEAVDGGCSLNLDFGDGSPPANNLVPCFIAVGSTCSGTTTHIFQNPGTYVLRASSSTCSAAAFRPDPVVRTISVVGLNIQRIDIYFNNRQPKMTVQQYKRNLKAFADIRYTGAGILQGWWEIDGRVFSRVNKQLYRGRQKVTIQTPLAPPLPTYAVGTHRVKFVITRPEQGIEQPQAIYFVEAGQEQFDIAIRLADPRDNKTVTCQPLTLRWDAAGKAYVYLVEFIEANSIDPIFSAYAKESAYTLRQDLCRSLLHSGRAYRWRVKGLSQEGLVIGESESFNLFLVPGEASQ